MRFRASAFTVAGLIALALSAHRAGAQLYSENFDTMLPGGAWNVNAPPAPNNTDTHADFFFDYATKGIPSAPNSVGGTTRGIYLAANLTAGIAGGVSVSPAGQAFAGDYTVRFDLWSNFLGAESATNPGEAGIWEGGPGSTHFSTYGVLSNGVGPNFISGSRAGVAEALFFANTGDGQTTFDYHIHGPGDPATDHGPGGFRATTEMGSATAFNNWDPVLDAGVFYADVYPEGHPDAGETNRGVTVDLDDPSAEDGFLYIEAFPSVDAPAAQNALFPFTQFGNTMPGAMGMAWREVEIKKVGNIVTLSVLNGGEMFDETFVLATVDLSLLKVPANSGTNIMFGHSDFLLGTSADPDYDELMFTLIDNVRVEALAPPAEDADFDNDNDVDGNDFLIWQRGNGGAGGNTAGDANADGSVNGSDLAVWKTKFGQTSAAAAAGAVPEPAAGVLALAAVGALVAGRRGRRDR